MLTVTTFYKFVHLPDYADYQAILRRACEERGIKGSILLAHEGINATVAGNPHAIETFQAFLATLDPFRSLVFKDSMANEMPFLRLKVRLKKEIVTMNQPGVDPRHSVGTYVKPQDWNALISDPSVVVIDTRNDYEVAIGTFRHARNPKTSSFTQLPGYIKENLDPDRHKKIAMFCTGGIRCEKSTAYMKQQGFEEVYHLEGGILSYLETVPPTESLWEGACFVFDQRVAVAQGLTPADYTMCYGCRGPLGTDDRLSPFYEEGVSCPRCYPLKSDLERANCRERHRQCLLAKASGRSHLGQKSVP